MREPRACKKRARDSKENIDISERKINTKIVETNDTIIGKIYHWHSLLTLAKKIFVNQQQTNDLPPLSCAK